MRSPRNYWLLIAALLGGSAVACGAFGAHKLKGHFEADGELSANEQRSLDVWETGTRYQIYHALALAVVGILADTRADRLLHLAGWSMTLGTLVFSGCLYALVLTGQRWLGAVVPIGGTLLILGWMLLAVCAIQAKTP